MCMCAGREKVRSLWVFSQASETPSEKKGLFQDAQTGGSPSVGGWGLLPSFSIPTLRHFMKRQAWQDLRLRFVISHSLVAGQLYSMFPVTRHRQGCQVLSRTLIPPPAKGLPCPSPRGSHRAVVPRAGALRGLSTRFQVS